LSDGLQIVLGRNGCAVPFQDTPLELGLPAQQRNNFRNVVNGLPLGSAFGFRFAVGFLWDKAGIRAARISRPLEII
jgi:hypothetical protein